MQRLNYCFCFHFVSSIQLIIMECSYHHHQHQLLLGLNRMRRSGTLTDVILCLGDKTYHVHKVVLSACSDYFRAMFTNDKMLEATSEKIKLCGIPEEGLEFLLEYMYTAKLGLTTDNVQAVLSAASHCQVMSVIKACAKYLQTQIDIENCIDIATIAENYSLGDLKDAIYSFICDNLKNVSKTSDFYRLTPEQIIHMLSSDHQFDCLELDLLKIVIEWFVYDVQSLSSKLDYAPEILSHIHFYKIVRKKLDLMLEDFYSSQNLDKHSNSLYHTIMVIARQPENSLKLGLCFDTFNSRGLEEALVKIGGFGNAGLTNGLTYCPLPLTAPSQKKRQWTSLTTIPHVDQCHYGVATLANHLYIVGGCFNQHLQEVIHQFGFRYSAAKDTWFRIAPMGVERCRFVLIEVGGKLYACGGAIEAIGLEVGEGTKTCECYDPITDSWNSIESMPEYRTQHAGASFTTSNNTNLLYISGGIHKDLVRDTLYSYNVNTNTWKVCASMLCPRADHFLLPCGSKLYACGGWRDEPDGDGATLRAQILTIDAYDIATDTWEVVTRVPTTPRYHSAIVAVRERIYFIGGFYEDTLYFKKIAPIECYDIITDTWTIDKLNAQDFWELSAVALYIPQYKRKNNELTTKKDIKDKEE